MKDFDFSDENVYQKVNGMYQIMVAKSEPHDLPYILSRQIVDDERAVIYVRRGTKVAHANSTDIARMIDKRINATVKVSSLELEDHLAQLRVLYKAINCDVDPFKYASGNVFMHSMFGFDVREEPKESYNEFILNVVSKRR